MEDSVIDAQQKGSVLSPWRTIRHRHVFIRPRRLYYYAAPSRPTTSSLMEALPLAFPSAGPLVRARLPAQQEFADEVKSKAVEAVRRKYGDTAAAAASAVMEQALARVLPSANPSITAEVALGRTYVRGSAIVEFTMDPLAAAGLKLRGGAPTPQLYARASFSFRGSLRTGTLDVTGVRAECGFRVG
jgi:hypothetical protein